MRAFAHPNPEDIRLEALLGALADPVRLQIVRKLRGSDGMACAFACPCEGVPKSTLSHHFRVLREAGLVRTEKRATAHINVLRYAEIEGRFPGLLPTILAFGTHGSERA
ncbi:MAG: helix-turn-helix transcriptional regulator [Silvanigrellales bacterium]|jgi:DNA-binding transcriptional ArsR family regulator|nr:helix-turn-helix transcriptional regulator [Silvanigrellales bacterium]